MPPHHKKGGATKSKLVIPSDLNLNSDDIRIILSQFPGKSIESIQRALNEALSPLPLLPDELMPPVEATVPQKYPLPPKAPLNQAWDWDIHHGNPAHELTDVPPPVAALHPLSPSLDFNWHEFFKNMQYASCKVQNIMQNMAFSHILFNYLYVHFEVFKHMITWISS
jgi:hypothetical protein